MLKKKMTLENIKLADLHCFKVLSQEKSFNDMARRYGISQSKVSIALKRLEEELEEKLVEREKFEKGFVVKEKGIELLKFINWLEEEINEVKEKISSIEKEKIIIGIPIDESMMVVGRYLKELYRNDELQIELRDKEDEGINYKIEYYLNDEKLSSNRKKYLGNIKVKIVYKDVIIKDIKDLQGKTIISLKQGSYHKKILDYIIKENNLNVNIRYTENISTMKMLIRNKFGVGIEINDEFRNSKINRLDISNMLEIKAYLEEIQRVTVESKEILCNNIFI